MTDTSDLAPVYTAAATRLRCLTHTGEPLHPEVLLALAQHHTAHPALSHLHHLHHPRHERGQSHPVGRTDVCRHCMHSPFTNIGQENPS